jgi:hypothetical protein
VLNSRILETAIGLVFVYLVFSLVASALAEYFSAYFDRRGEHLKHVLFNLFDNDDPRGRGFLNLFVSHPMVQALNATDWSPTFLKAEERIGQETGLFRKAHDEWYSASRAVNAATAARNAADAADATAAKATAAVKEVAKQQKAGAGPALDAALAAAAAAAVQAETAAATAASAAAAADAAAKDVAQARAVLPGRESDPASPAGLTAPPATPVVADNPPETPAPPPDATAPALAPAPDTAPALDATRLVKAVTDRATRAAAEATKQAKQARRSAGATVKANSALYSDLIRLVDVPRYIPDRTFADVIVNVLTSDSTLDLLERAELGAGAPVRAVNIASFWDRIESAMGVVRGVASRLADSDAKARVLEGLGTLDDVLARLHNGEAMVTAVVSDLEAGTNRLRGAIAAVPDDALRAALEREVDASLRPLYAIGRDILTLQRAGEAIARLADSSLKTALASFLDQAGEDLGQFKRSVSAWYNDVMDHASGWYKRNTQKILFGIAIVLCLLNNVDTVAIVGHLSTDPALRAATVAEARRFQADADTDAAAASNAASNANANAIAAQTPIAAHRAPVSPSRKTPEELKEALAKTDLPLWWTKDEWTGLWWQKDGKAATPGGEKRPAPSGSWSTLLTLVSPNYWNLLSKLLGLALSVMAVSMGAPFWFDVLNKIVNVRLVGKRPEPTDTNSTPAPVPAPTPTAGPWPDPAAPQAARR